jgi:3-phenylpropionate/trans-cinnamate dioxygenase ferredoxin subunit
VIAWTNVGAAEGRPDLGAVVVGGREIALARLDDGSWAAFDNTCPHEECPLADGDLDGYRITCYCHSSAFDVRTGELLHGPAQIPIDVFPVRVEDGDLQVAVE